LRRSASRVAGLLDAPALALAALAVSATGARGVSEISRYGRSSCICGGSEIPCDRSFMTTAREDTTRLAALLRREHDALAEFLCASSDMGNVLD
jgi:hypothetical protein